MPTQTTATGKHGGAAPSTGQDAAAGGPHGRLRRPGGGQQAPAPPLTATLPQGWGAGVAPATALAKVARPHSGGPRVGARGGICGDPSRMTEWRALLTDIVAYPASWAKTRVSPNERQLWRARGAQSAPPCPPWANWAKLGCKLYWNKKF
jgi:hypothetical protein